ncbi:MAG: divalent-cation tolerance protein CutA [Pseudomonadota bacterium]
MNTIAVTTTTGQLDEARLMARMLVERGLAACAQITPIESFFPWEGTVHNEQEFRVLFKTTGDRYAEVEQAIRALHSYTLPAIHAETLGQVYPPYAEWIADNARGSM